MAEEAEKLKIEKKEAAEKKALEKKEASEKKAQEKKLAKMSELCMTCPDGCNLFRTSGMCDEYKQLGCGDIYCSECKTLGLHNMEWFAHCIPHGYDLCLNCVQKRKEKEEKETKARKSEEDEKTAASSQQNAKREAVKKFAKMRQLKKMPKLGLKCPDGCQMERVHGMVDEYAKEGCDDIYCSECQKLKLHEQDWFAHCVPHGYDLCINCVQKSVDQQAQVKVD